MKKNEVTEVKKCCEPSSKEVSKKVDSNVNLGVVSELKKTSKKKKAVEDMSFDELVNEFKFDN